MARKRITSRPGLFGTVYYYDEKGRPVGKSRPGLLGNTRVYSDENGDMLAKSRPGFFAKEVFTDKDFNSVSSIETLGGTLHFRNGVSVGHTTPGFFGSAYTSLETEDEAVQKVYCDDEEFLEDEPLEEDAFYDDEDEMFTDGENEQKTVIKNVLIFVACVLVCAVIVCFAALRK